VGTVRLAKKVRAARTAEILGIVDAARAGAAAARIAEGGGAGIEEARAAK
jgi:hypothetical protein